MMEVISRSEWEESVERVVRGFMGGRMGGGERGVSPLLSAGFIYHIVMSKEDIFVNLSLNQLHDDSLCASYHGSLFTMLT